MHHVYRLCDFSKLECKCVGRSQILEKYTNEKLIEKSRVNKNLLKFRFNNEVKKNENGHNVMLQSPLMYKVQRC